MDELNCNLGFFFSAFLFSKAMEKKRVIIDTDCGIDDAQAIMMALAAPNVEVVGVTCVFGNAAIENVCQNVLQVLSACEREGVGSPIYYFEDKQ